MHSNELKAKSLEVELYLKRLEQEVIINQEAQIKIRPTAHNTIRYDKIRQEKIR
jgi:hypothetical protein